MDSLSNLPMIGVGFLALLISITLRLWAKAWLMDRLGDPTPRLTGRVSMNPFDHFDMVGTLLIPVIFLLYVSTPPVYGWGKHIYSHPSAFARPARDEVLVSLVGSAMNLVAAFLIAFLGGFLIKSQPSTASLIDLLVQQNILLAVFSLLPVPPLDGAVIVKHLFRMSEEAFYRYSQWSLLLFIAIIFIKPLSLIINVPYAIFYTMAWHLMF
jgi:Zn-dependent protease